MNLYKPASWQPGYAQIIRSSFLVFLPPLLQLNAQLFVPALLQSLRMTFLGGCPLLFNHPEIEVLQALLILA